tara:strand:- start:3139 stop:4674 length:1536 start_codon:yes stop_codon:yes gene_type:complete
MAWSDLAESIQQDGAEEAAVARLAEIGVEETVLREAMARKVVNQARIEAVREFRRVLAEPSAAYAPVQVAGYEPVNSQSSSPTVASHQPVAGQWVTMTPSEAVLKFFEHNPRTGGKDGNSRKKGEPWTLKTRNQFELPAMLLEQVMDGRALATVTHDDLVKLDQCFEKLHGPSFRKSPKHRDMTIWQIIDETEAKVVAGEEAMKKEAKRKGRVTDTKIKPAEHLSRKELGLGVVTTNRHWGFLRQLTGWFNKHHPLGRLDYGAFIMNDTRNQRELQSVYTVEQGREIFNLPPWTGSKSHARRMQPGDLLVHDAWYFVPLIAWYSGMRRDEICGLDVNDVETEDGFWFFNVRANDVRRVKTISSARKVPVAKELQRLGLIDYVTALREAGEKTLFPELVAESGLGQMGDAYYKRIWTKIAKELAFLKGGQAMHAFRHTAIDSMKGAGIPSEIRADFAGHALKGETEGRYSKAHMALLRNAVATIPEVTKHLAPFPVSLLPAKLREPRKARVK